MIENKTYIFSALGTDNEIQLWDFDTSLQKELFLMIEQYESELSYYRHNSIVSNINNYAGKSFIHANEDVLYLIEKANYYHTLTNVFNLLVKPAQIQYVQIGISLSPTQIKLYKKHTQMRNILIREDTVMLKNHHIQLDLGGIAKGYIVDRISNFLLSSKVPKGILNFGGDIFVWDNKNESFHIGIRDPFASHSDFSVLLKLENESLSTSGTYERFNKLNKQFHHVIDPRTMKPVNNELISVSVIDKTAVDTDVLATIFLILGIKETMKLIRKQKLTCTVVFITTQNEIYCTENIRRKLINTKKEIHYL